MDFREQRKQLENVRPIFYTSPADEGSYYNRAYSPTIHDGYIPAMNFINGANSFPKNEHTSLKRDEGHTVDELHQRNKRRCLLVAVIVVLTLLICGIVGAIIGFVFANENDKSSQSGPLTKTRIVEQRYPGEATLNDLVFTQDYKNPDSIVYRQTENDFIAKVDNQMRLSGVGDTYNRTVINSFSEGSVVVYYYIVVHVVVIRRVDENGTETDTTQTQVPPVRLAVLAEVVSSVDIVKNDSVTVAETSACDSSPCLNGGSCNGVKTYRCECLAGYSGSECEIDIDECSSSPCENNGTCTDQINSFTCDCETGYSGFLCDIGSSLDCTFESNLCFYNTSGGWRRETSYEYLDEQDITASIEPTIGAMALVKFDEKIPVDSELTSLPTTVHTDSCLIFTYTGTVERFDVFITYDNGTVKSWQDPTVRGNNHDWKPALIDVASGHVSVSFKTSMISREEGFPTLQLGVFLLIDTIRLEYQRCLDLDSIPACPTGMSMCGDRSQCIPDEYFCDFYKDCPDSSDEIEEIDACLKVYNLTCTFEDEYPFNMCFYETLEETDTWYTTQSRFNQLPATDHTLKTKSGHYLMHSISEDFSGNHYIATLNSAPVLYDTDMCVTFWYFINSTRFQPDGVTAQLFVSVDYQDDVDLPKLYWYDSADRHLPDWMQGAVPVEGNRKVKLQVTAKTSTPISVWPGVVALDDIAVIQGNCGITQDCRPNTFECSDTRVCIPFYFRCDGKNDCSDESDERDCEEPVNVINVIGGDGSYGRARAFIDKTWRPVCFPDVGSEMVAMSVCRSKEYTGLTEAFKYPNADSNQEPASLNCTNDGNCTATVSTCSSFLGVKCSKEVCFAGKRLCPGSEFHCIPESRFCDGLQDCEGNTDELGCVNCTTGEFECGNHVCVSLFSRCNGTVECEDGTDEFRCVQVDMDVGTVTVWDQYNLTRKPVCFDEIDEDTAEKLCQLSGNGYIATQGVDLGNNTVPNGVQVLASQDPTNGTLVPGLDKIGEKDECYPLHLKCALPECGTTIAKELAIQNYINFGDEIVLGEYPWHCTLFSDKFLCGVSYIGHGYFLTAAHCVQSDASYTVTCGTISVNHLGEHGARYTITRYTSHPQYVEEDNMQSNNYDIAVLQTSTPPMIDNFTRPICLGNSDDWAYISGLGNAAECYTTGFGRTETDRTEGIDEDQELLETKVDFIDIDICREAFTEPLFEDSICIKSESWYPPTCRGDSGSATVCRDPRDGRWYQFSLTSYGYGCYATGTPDVQNKVFPYFEWIKEITGLDFTKA